MYHKFRAEDNSKRLGAFAFAQLFLREAKEGTLIFTGATAGKLLVSPNRLPYR
jgi:hypothetical protein